jgi:hypothetical protein
VGVFDPARYALSDRLELVAHPLLFFVAPNGEARVRHVEVAGFQLTGVYALSMPSLAFRLSKGYLFPAAKHDEHEIGWTLVPRAGLLASRGARAESVVTVGFDVAAGLPIVKGDARPLEALAPLDVLLAPALAGYRARVGGLWDRRLGERWRGRVWLDAYLHGVDDEHPHPGHARFSFAGGGGVDLRVGQRSRLVLGLAIWNHFQHARDADGGSVRSTDVFPVVDFIWAGQR